MGWDWNLLIIHNIVLIVIKTIVVPLIELGIAR